MANSDPSAPADLKLASDRTVEGVWKGTESCGWQWDSDPYLKRLRWQANGMAYELAYMGMGITKEDLILIANGIK